MTEERMPAMFVGHGSPMNAIGDNRARRDWLRIGKELSKPKAIIGISAHWTSSGSTLVRRSAVNRQIYDMYGFPDELYRIRYAPPGDVEVADRVLSALGPVGREDDSWGLDHGLWSVLSNMFPDADVPVVPVSVDTSASPDRLYRIGQALSPLRDEGCMIIGSGNVVHNLRMVDWHSDRGYIWADSFDDAVRRAVLDGDHGKVLAYEGIDGWEKAVPTVEHFEPLPVILGAVRPDDRVSVFAQYRELGSMSMTSYLFRRSDEGEGRDPLPAHPLISFAASSTEAPCSTISETADIMPFTSLCWKMFLPMDTPCPPASSESWTMLSTSMSESIFGPPAMTTGTMAPLTTSLKESMSPV